MSHTKNSLKSWRIRKTIEMMVFLSLIITDLYHMGKTDNDVLLALILVVTVWWVFRLVDTWEAFWDGPDD